MGFSHLGVGALMIPHLGGDTPWYLAGGAPNPVVAYQARGAASYAASLINLVTPGTFDLTEGNGAVTWDAVNGWQFVSANAKYFNTNVVNNSGWSAIAQYANTSGGASTVYWLGVFTAGGNTRLGLGYRVGGNQIRYMAGQQLDVIPKLDTGNVAVAGQQGYRNGVADGGAIGAWSGTASRAITIGANNNNGVIEGYLTGNIYAIAIYNLTLTPSQVLAVATAMAAL